MAGPLLARRYGGRGRSSPSGLALSRSCAGQEPIWPDSRSLCCGCRAQGLLWKGEISSVGSFCRPSRSWRPLSDEARGGRQRARIVLHPFRAPVECVLPGDGREVHGALPAPGLCEGERKGGAAGSRGAPRDRGFQPLSQKAARREGQHCLRHDGQGGPQHDDGRKPEVADRPPVQGASERNG